MIAVYDAQVYDLINALECGEVEALLALEYFERDNHEPREVVEMFHFVFAVPLLIQLLVDCLETRIRWSRKMSSYLSAIHES